MGKIIGGKMMILPVMILPALLVRSVKAGIAADGENGYTLVVVREKITFEQ